jgi:proteic killer suppression protein
LDGGAIDFALYCARMIASFRHKGLKEFFETGSKRGISADLAARIGRRLDALQAANALTDIDGHGFGLHRLKGVRQGEWAIWVSGNWRITFMFEKGDALDVNLEDYH